MQWQYLSAEFSGGGMFRTGLKVAYINGIEIKKKDPRVAHFVDMDWLGVLNVLGGDGWELVGFFPLPGNLSGPSQALMALFKRPVPIPPQQ